MKTKITPILAALTTAGLLASTSAHAWLSQTTYPLAKDTAQALTGVRGNSSSNPEFGAHAWAMQGRWLTFNATQGQRVTITVNTTTSPTACHPAITIWKRPQGNFTYNQGLAASPTAQTLNLATHGNVPGGYEHTSAGILTGTTTKAYASDHNFIPTSSFILDNVVLEDGTAIGDVRMLHVMTAYDSDLYSTATRVGNQAINHDPLFRPVQDGTPGTLVVSFVPDETSDYQVFLGGYAPENGANDAFNVNVTATGIN